PPRPTPIRATLPPQQRLRQVPQTTPFRYRYPCVTPKICAQTPRKPTQPVQHPHPQHQPRHVSVPFIRSKECPPWTHTTSRAHSTNPRSEEHTSELQSRFDLVCRLLLE